MIRDQLHGVVHGIDEAGTISLVTRALQTRHIAGWA